MNKKKQIKKMIIIDDNLDIITSLSDYINNNFKGISISSFKSIYGCALSSTYNVDLILVDLWGTGEGIEEIKKLKSISIFRNSKMIVMSATQEDRDQICSEGLEFIEKDDLLDKLINYFFV